MMDNLYMDKLKGRITESAYDRFYETFKDQSTDIGIVLVMNTLLAVDFC